MAVWNNLATCNAILWRYFSGDRVGAGENPVQKNLHVTGFEAEVHIDEVFAMLVLDAPPFVGGSKEQEDKTLNTHVMAITTSGELSQNDIQWQATYSHLV